MALTTEDGLRLVRRYGAAERWPAVLVTTRTDGRPSVCVVNAGVLPHPVTGLDTVAFVARGSTAKLGHAAGGDHPDLAEYDRVMAAEWRATVLLHPHHFTTNPAGTAHQETP